MYSTNKSKDTCFFVDLNGSKVAFKPDDFTDKLTMSNTNLKVHGNSMMSNQAATSNVQYSPIHTWQLHSFAGLSQLDKECTHVQVGVSTCTSPMDDTIANRQGKTDSFPDHSH